VKQVGLSLKYFTQFSKSGCVGEGVNWIENVNHCHAAQITLLGHSEPDVIDTSNSTQRISCTLENQALGYCNTCESKYINGNNPFPVAEAVRGCSYDSIACYKSQEKIVNHGVTLTFNENSASRGFCTTGLSCACLARVPVCPFDDGITANFGTCR